MIINKKMQEQITNNEKVNKGFINRTIIFLLILYFFLCPFEYILNSISFTGSSIKYLGLLIIVLIVFDLFYSNKKINKVPFLLIIWIFIEIFSILWSVGTEGVQVYFGSYVNIVVYAVVLSMYSFDRKELSFFENSLLLGSLLFSVLMICIPSSYHQIGFRETLFIAGAELDPNNIACFLLFGAVISLYRFLFCKNKRIIYLLCFSISLFSLLLTGSRGGFVGLGLSLLIMLVIFLYRKKGRILVKLSLLFLVLFGAYIIVNVFLPNELYERFFSFNTYETGSGRTEIWNRALPYIGKRLLFGNGMGSVLSIGLGTAGSIAGMHNTYLTIIFEVGIVGFIFFAAFLMSLFVKSVKNKCFLHLILLIAILCCAFFLDSLVKRFFWNAIIFAILINNCISIDNKSEGEEV